MQSGSLTGSLTGLRRQKANYTVVEEESFEFLKEHDDADQEEEEEEEDQQSKEQIRPEALQQEVQQLQDRTAMVTMHRDIRNKQSELYVYGHHQSSHLSHTDSYRRRKEHQQILEDSLLSPEQEKKQPSSTDPSVTFGTSNHRKPNGGRRTGATKSNACNVSNY